MNKTFRQLKKGLRKTFRGHRTRIGTDSDRYGEEMKIEVGFRKKPNRVCFRFRLDYDSNNLAAFMDVIEKTGRRENARHTYSFSDTIRQENIPGFSADVDQLLKTAFLYAHDKNKIVSVIDPQIQAQIYIEVIDQSFYSIGAIVAG